MAMISSGLPRNKQKVRLSNRHKNWRIVMPLAVFGIAGMIWAGLSYAAVYVTHNEAESGALAGGASTISNATASGASAVRFGSSGQSPCADAANLQFCDDFTGAAGAAPDSAKWHILTGSMWGGQCFRNAAENISLDGQGNLKQTLINKGTTQCADERGYPTTVTSGGMDTQGKAYFKYGKFEIRAKLSCAKSVWGAIWTATGTGPAWPQSGEMDIYELFDNVQSAYKQTIHAGNPHWQKGSTYNYGQPLCQDFHVYGMDWRAGSIQFTLDGVTVSAFTPADANGQPWPFDTYDQRLIIDLQYGSPGWPGAGSWDLNELPSSMLVDYVRIWK